MARGGGGGGGGGRGGRLKLRNDGITPGDSKQRWSFSPAGGAAAERER